MQGWAFRDPLTRERELEDASETFLFLRFRQRFIFPGVSEFLQGLEIQFVRETDTFVLGIDRELPKQGFVLPDCLRADILRSGILHELNPPNYDGDPFLQSCHLSRP